MSHTAKPWEVSHTTAIYLSDQERGGPKGGPVYVNRIDSEGIIGLAYVVLDSFDEFSAEESAGNMLLIKAAPDLAEACEAMLKCEFHGDLSAALEVEEGWPEEDHTISQALRMMVIALQKAGMRK